MASTAKLEPFLLMAKSAKGAATSKLIENATAAPGVYVYAELLDVPNVKEVCVWAAEIPLIMLPMTYNPGLAFWESPVYRASHSSPDIFIRHLRGLQTYVEQLDFNALKT